MAGQPPWEWASALLAACERVPDQPEHRRPEADEERSPLRIAPLVLVDRLCTDPEADAEADRAERRGLELPGAKPEPMEKIQQHLVTVPAPGPIDRTCRRPGRGVRPERASSADTLPPDGNRGVVALRNRADLVELHVAYDPHQADGGDRLDKTRFVAPAALGDGD